jgi:hypothetical protein
MPNHALKGTRRQMSSVLQSSVAALSLVPLGGNPSGVGIRAITGDAVAGVKSFGARNMVRLLLQMRR